MIVIILIGVLTIYLGFVEFSKLTPMDAYNVYLDGKLLGTVASKDDFDDYINKKDESIKRKYGVNKVYVPNGVIVKKVVTYNSKIDSDASVYNKIVKLKQFTIRGTVITIKKNKDEIATGSVSDKLFDVNNNSLEDDVKDKDSKNDKNIENLYIYVLNKNIFDDAIVKLIKSFVNEDEYNKYMNSEQAKIVDVGSVIKDIDIYEDITYRSGFVSISEDIYTNADDLAKYLLYGTLEDQNTYTVKEGDTIETIAASNKLNTQEFLLANSSFKSKDTLLYAGQEVNVGLINPVINIVVEYNRVEDEERDFNVDIKYDESQLQNVEYVSQEGEKGLYRVDREYQYINGQLAASQTLGSTELKPTVDKIIVKGSKEIPSVADLSYWAWPTEKPYTITTYFGYRWGSMHAAVDITGPGWGSNVYAANNGVVVETRGGCTPGNLSCNGRRGNFIVINHNNKNYYTEYMHLSSILVSAGQTVSRGQKIATMGNTGEVYPSPGGGCTYCGTHLHFATYVGRPLFGGSAFDPLTLY